MGGHATGAVDKAALWGGKESPYKTSYGKLMMWFFLVSDALTFSGLLAAYGFIRHTYDGEWPVGEEVFHSLPFTSVNAPLIYVAFMTFILIVSSVTMVMAVEAGHRNDRRGVTKWMIYTVIGGFIFLGSQVWEWSHFIHGSHFGKIQLNDGSYATVEGEFGVVDSLVYLDAHAMGHEDLHAAHPEKGHDHGDHGHGHAEEHAPGGHDGHGHGPEVLAGHSAVISDHPSKHQHGAHGVERVITGGDADHHFRHALTAGHVRKHGDQIIMTDHHHNHYIVYKQENEDVKLTVREGGSKHEPGDEIDGEEAVALYEEAIYSGEARRVIFGANLKANEYGPVQYGQFFFFITGFHGFHVFSGVLINLIILLQVLGGVMERRGHYEMVEKVGLYWHFVDLVWVFVFTFFYLI